VRSGSPIVSTVDFASPARDTIQKDYWYWNAPPTYSVWAETCYEIAHLGVG
jgi:hypothetical protein